MIKITHATGGFTDGVEAVIVDGNKIAGIDGKGKAHKCTWDAEWLIRQAAKKDADLRFEFVPKNN